MKRDMDLVRGLMLALEGYDPEEGLVIFEPPFEEPPFEALKQDGHSPEMIGRHLAWLYEAGFIEGAPYPMRSGFTFERVSWNGCDFLDAVRDPEVWKRTKAGASKMGGWTVSLLKDISTAYLKHMAKERLGLDL